MATVWRVLKILFLIWLVVTIALAVWYWPMIRMVATYNTIIWPPMYDEPANAAEARAQDLDYLHKLATIDRSFSDAARSDFTAQVEALEARVETLSTAEFYLGISQAIALADNGHTNLSVRPLYTEFPSIEAKFYWFADGLFIVRASDTHADTVGTRVVAVEGTPIATVVETLARYRGGNDAWRRVFMPLMIEAPEIMHAAGLTASPAAITLSLETPTGAIREETFPARTIPDATELPRRRAFMVLLNEPLPDEDDSWTLTLPEGEEAMQRYLRDSHRPDFNSLPGNGHYIRTVSGFSAPGQSLQEFFMSALEGIEDGALDYIVLDYRLNSGGDYMRSMDFAKTVGAKVKDGGRVYLAVGPYTFSAGIVTVAMAKYYSGDKALIIGETMGDRAQFWAETGMTFRLPNSQYYVNYATGYHDWENGCKGEPYCFTLNEMHEVPAGSLAPQVLLAPTYAEFASGRDVVMEWVLAQHGAAE